MLLTLQILVVLLCVPMLLLGLATSLSGATRLRVFQRFMRPMLLLSPLLALVAVGGSAALALAGFRVAAIASVGVLLTLWACAIVWLQLKTRFFIARRHVRRRRSSR